MFLSLVLPVVSKGQEEMELCGREYILTRDWGEGSLTVFAKKVIQIGKKLIGEGKICISMDSSPGHLKIYKHKWRLQATVISKYI